MKGHQQFFSAITLDRDKIERCKRHRCVQAGDKDGLICNMTFRSGHDLDLWSNFQHKLLRSHNGSFDVSRQEEHDAVKMNVVPLLSQKLLTKNVFRKNGYFQSFCSLEAEPLILGQI